MARNSPGSPPQEQSPEDDPGERDIPAPRDPQENRSPSNLASDGSLDAGNLALGPLADGLSGPTSSEDAADAVTKGESVDTAPEGGGSGQDAVDNRPNFFAFMMHVTDKSAAAKTFSEAFRANLPTIIVLMAIPLIVVAAAIVVAVIYFYLRTDPDRWAWAFKLATMCFGTTGTTVFIFAGVRKFRAWRRRNNGPS